MVLTIQIKIMADLFSQCWPFSFLVLGRNETDLLLCINLTEKVFGIMKGKKPLRGQTSGISDMRDKLKSLFRELGGSCFIT